MLEGEAKGRFIEVFIMQSWRKEAKQNSGTIFQFAEKIHLTHGCDGGGGGGGGGAGRWLISLRSASLFLTTSQIIFDLCLWAVPDRDAVKAWGPHGGHLEPAQRGGGWRVHAARWRRCPGPAGWCLLRSLSVSPLVLSKLSNSLKFFRFPVFWFCYFWKKRSEPRLPGQLGRELSGLRRAPPPGSRV